MVLYRSYADRKDFDSLITLCRDRYHAARGPHALIRWRKDEAIAEALQGNYLTAHGLLDDVSWLAGLAPCGKYENEFGVVLARLGRSSLALERFNLSYQRFRASGNLAACAGVDHNRARALVTRGEHLKAARYIRRALDYARAHNNFRLELEVLESIKEFGGMR